MLHRTGYPLYSENNIQGLFNDFQETFLTIFKDHRLMIPQNCTKWFIKQ